jgi:ABC-type branched-subunit amino acid transport system substrate-binding protein
MPRLPAETTNACRIGLLLPPAETEADSLRQGALLAIRHARQEGGVEPELVIRGQPGQWGTDGDEAVRLALDEGSLGLVTPPDGSASHQVLQVAGRTAIPVVSLCPDTSVTSAGIPWMVRVVPGTDQQAAALWSQLPARAGRDAKRWVVFVPDERAGREARNDLTKAAVPYALEWAAFLQVTNRLAEPNRLAREAIATRPDAVLLWVEPEMAGKLARALREAGYGGLLAGSARLQSRVYAAAAGEAGRATWLVQADLGSLSEAAFDRFARDYRTATGLPPDATAADTYDAIRMLVFLLREHEGEPPHRVFPLTRPLPGASGTLNFDREGRRQARLQVVTLGAGRYGLLPSK